MTAKLKSGKRPEYIVFFLFIIAYCVISSFHEPWFDEAQAWQIAKCADLKEILFELPHYEGHPPLWHLILAIPAKSGLSFEIGLKLTGLLITSLSAALMLFRSKLPRAARLLLPFSYFFFYQYGVIVRPYCLMLLVMLVLGKEFNSRKEHPWRILGLLILLCLTSAYGIVFAGGIAICMLWELCGEKGIKNVLRGMPYDSRPQSLAVLLMAAILLIIEIFPKADTYSPAVLEGNSFFLCFMCTLFTLFGECFLTSGSWFSMDRMLLQNVHISIPELIVFIFVGFIFWFLIICVSSKKNLKFLVIPYILFALFAAKVYFTGHHLGIALILLLFWFEFQWRDGDLCEIGRHISKRISKTERDRRLLKSAAVGIGVICLLLPLYWSCAAAYHDIKWEYSSGRSIASYIKEHGMEESLILTDWNVGGSLYPQSMGKAVYMNPYMSGAGTLLSAYFSRNMALNLNDGDDHLAYNYHKLGSYEESQNAKLRWASRGRPDLIIGHPKLELAYGDALDYSEYTLVKLSYVAFIWKSGCVYSSMPVFVRNDLLDVYGVEPAAEMEEIAVNGLKITDEMREQYENGVPVEEILAPYLDALFGPEKQERQ